MQTHTCAHTLTHTHTHTHTHAHTDMTTLKNSLALIRLMIIKNHLVL